MSRLHIYVALILFCLPGLAQAQQPDIPTPVVIASLINDSTAIAPATPLKLAIQLKPREGWHTYWQNPGDSGIATSLSWTLPEGFSASAIAWPVPQRLVEGPLVTYGYKGDVLLPVTIMPPDTLSAKNYTLMVKASWLVCKEICIPESATLSIDLPVGKPESSSHHALFNAHYQAQPLASAEASSFTYDEHSLTFSMPLDDLGANALQDVLFFPRTENVIRYSGDSSFDVQNGVLTLTQERSGSNVPESIKGLVVLIAKAGTSTSFDIAFQRSELPAPAQKTLWLPSILLLALLGGLILNLMPCVLPVLSLKALAIVKKAASDHRYAKQQGIAYTAGILVSFAALAALLLFLKASGESIGWGYQMQSPAFVGFLIYLLFLVGLSLSGVFHLPVIMGNRAPSNDESLRGSFLTGILATAVATPCTAPFMATAVGAALKLPTWQALLVFEALGLGLALPFLLISFFPACLRILPKPGAWMESFKQFLALPMYASVLWLLWVLTLQTGADGMLIATSGMLAFIIILWAKTLFAYGSARYRLLALLATIVILAVSLPMLASREMPNQPTSNASDTHGVKTIPYDKNTLSDLRNAGTPVYVDATAAWCITCQVNARVALHTEASMKAFQDNGVVLMIADWTKRDPTITEFLQSFGYQGVPLNVFYPAHGKAVILPQLLTESIVIQTIKGE
ncbi:MAG: protein-disulfide reductase DsbD family protein [Rickettsiales bacterium]|nr:protein-disulfide reductase DsbD family protein [Rickettsiales bacterium]